MYHAFSLRAKEDLAKKHTVCSRIVCFSICGYLPRLSHCFDHCLVLEQSREAGLFVRCIFNIAQTYHELRITLHPRYYVYSLPYQLIPCWTFRRCH